MKMELFEVRFPKQRPKWSAFKMWYTITYQYSVFPTVPPPMSFSHLGDKINNPTTSHNYYYYDFHCIDTSNCIIGSFKYVCIIELIRCLFTG